MYAYSTTCLAPLEKHFIAGIFNIMFCVYRAAAAAADDEADDDDGDAAVLFMLLCLCL